LLANVVETGKRGVARFKNRPQQPKEDRAGAGKVRDALLTRRGIVSTQIVQEFLNVALHKFKCPMTVSDAQAYLKAVLIPLCQQYPTGTFYDRALLVKAETGYSFYDSLVVTGAIEAGCSALLSEDLQDGRVIQGLTIVNPFAA